ncbi:hypothetical protein A2Z33_03860 [Candidatus Gottesmanbacteria bacterium RBG_16_52_11]|uniref:Membrane protein 6-pyruvoyl-tetrahydropterin synthase-related domain-containing protein n=1 Tax=Candidatus Gottesmanbacteria bacterium RBG_16_52_11 TaxID=1798374 RepID=A0A1F5YWB1_9BACT|nr:MAG: hypothetical protein A2Z33_03860 [Candidatus Gottesmanbacteria bacterium RBG_16_52_11]
MSDRVRQFTEFIRRRWPLLVMPAVILAVFAPFITPPSGYLLFGDDFFRSYGFFRQYFARSLSGGEMPWWNPYLFSGMPFAANPSVSFWYPPNLLYLILPYGTAYIMILIFHIAVAAAGVYYLLRKAMRPGTGELPAAAAGITFALSGYFSARIWSGHVDTIAAQSYMPWVVGAMFLLWQKPSVRRLAAASLALAVQIYAGYQTMAMYTLEIVALAVMLFSLYRKSLRPLVLTAAAVIGGLGFAALQMIPNWEFFGRSIRTFPMPYEYLSRGSLVWGSLIQLLYPFHWGDQYSFRGPPPNYGEQAMYVGVVGIVLAVAALIIYLPKFFEFPGARKKDENIIYVAIFAAAAVISVWLALGPNAPYDLNRFLWEYVPLYRGIRHPSRHLIQFVLAASVLTGVGLSRVKHRFLQLMLTALLIADMGIFARHFLELKPAPETRHDRLLVAGLTGGGGPYRLLQNFGTWVPPRDALDFDAAVVYGIFSATGYDPSILRNYYEFADAVNGNPGTGILEHNVQIPYLNTASPYIGFLNIRYILVPIGYDPVGGSPDRYSLIAENPQEGYRLYENRSVSPRFFAVKTVTILPARSDVAAAVRSNTGDISETVYAASGDVSNDAATQPSDCKSGSDVRIVLSEYTVNRITLKTQSDCNAVLASSEVMYPGWTASIDGRPAKLFESNLAFRTLILPRGTHTVEMRFVPRTVAFGLSITFGTALLFAFILRTDAFRKGV